jgi:hypothetical protein
VEKIAIANYADGEGVVRDRTFEGGEIVGPVALIPIGADNQVIDREYNYTPEYLAQLRLGKRVPVLLIGCTLRRCKFAVDVDTSELRPS